MINVKSLVGDLLLNFITEESQTNWWNVVFLLTEKRNLKYKKLSSHGKILYMKVKNVLTKKEKRQETLTRKSMIGQLSTTGREGSAQNITREEVFIRYGKKNGKKAPKQRFVIFGEVIKVGNNEDMYKIKFTSPVS